MLDQFFLLGDIPSNAHVGAYNLALVLLSYVIASVGAYAGLSLALDIYREPRRSMRLLLHVVGALALGTGIWSMHFVGMLSYKMDMAMSYDVGLTTLSMMVAVVFAYCALWVTQLRQFNVPVLFCGSLFLAAAVCGMHYLGMAAMQMDATLLYRPDIFSLSVLVAFLASGAALAIIFYIGNKEIPHRAWWIVAAGLVMGLAVCGMHYTGMAAAVIIPFADCRYNPNQSFEGLALAVAGVSFLIFIAAAMLSAYVRPRQGKVGIFAVPVAILVFGLGVSGLLHRYVYNFLLDHVRFETMAEPLNRPTSDQLWAAPLVLVFGILFSVIISAYVFTFLRQQQLDMHAQKKLREEIAEKERLRVEANRASMAKTQFLANISHEIRTPLNGMIGLTQMLEDSETNPERRESLSVILHSSEVLLLLLNDLLDVSKIEAGELGLEKMPFNIHSIIKNIVNMFGPMAQGKGIAFNVNTDRLGAASLIGDSTRITQILMNLVGNAVKFTESGGVTLEVATQPIPGTSDIQLSLSVRDTGIGIADDARNRLFKNFSQADSSMNRRFGGTGLGLAISKSLAELMGGSISFDSTINVGSVFVVTVPLSLAPQDVIADNRARARAQVAEGQRAYGDLRVLVVDDHQVNMFFATKLLRQIGFVHIAEAGNGVQAVKAAHDARYDLILMDCQMPEMDGFEATRRIRQWESTHNGLRMPIIAMTAHAMEGDRELCLQAGMDDYISKPVSLDKLHNVISYWIFGDEKAEESAQSFTPSAQPFTYEDFRAFFDGDDTEERMLAGIFEKTGRKAIAEMQSHIDGEADAQVWRIAAHRLKGASAQMGARALSSLCQMAEKGVDLSSGDKHTLLRKVNHAFDNVVQFFQIRHEK